MNIKLRHIILCFLMMVFIATVQGFASPCNNREVVSADLQPYKYNGKELDKMHGLNTYDYGARQYYSILGRWDRVDPLAEKKPWQSPYVYGRNNPLRYIDPDGKDDWDKINGFAIGLLTDVVPGSDAMRDAYIPNNHADYNTGLKSADITSCVIGTALVIDGGEKVAAGLGVASTSAAVTVGSGGFSTPITAVTAAGGADIAIQGAAEAGLGAVMLAKASNNSSKGYNRGGKNSANEPKSINQLNKEISKKKKTPLKRFDGIHIKGGQEHVHFKNGGALNKDGTWKDKPEMKIDNKTKEYLSRNGWNVDK